MRRLPHDLATPLVAIAAAFVAAGGWVHLREWLETYRDVPADAPGAAVVTVGFPIHVVLSVLAVAALVGALVRWQRLLPLAILGTALFQAGALASLILTRTGGLFGWSEPVWTRGAEQTRAVEIGALVALALAGALLTLARRQAVAPTPARA